MHGQERLTGGVECIAVPCIYLVNYNLQETSLFCSHREGSIHVFSAHDCCSIAAVGLCLR